jgi:hypothetical protein
MQSLMLLRKQNILNLPTAKDKLMNKFAFGIKHLCSFDNDYHFRRILLTNQSSSQLASDSIVGG